MAIPTSSSDLTKEYLNSVLEDFQEIVKVKHFGYAFMENFNIARLFFIRNTLFCLSLDVS